MKRSRRVARAGEPGFTLLECLVTLSIFLVVLYAVYLVYDVGEANYTRGSRQWDVQSQARIALDRMAREIRMAGYAATKITQPIMIATNDTLSFKADLDGNGTVEIVTYSRRDSAGNQATTLYRNAHATQYCGGEPFIEGVTALKFTYYEIANVPIPYPLTATYTLDGQDYVTGASTPSLATMTARGAVRQIKIEMTVEQQVGQSVTPFTVTTDVTLRNLVP